MVVAVVVVVVEDFDSRNARELAVVSLSLYHLLRVSPSPSSSLLIVDDVTPRPCHVACRQHGRPCGSGVYLLLLSRRFIRSSFPRSPTLNRFSVVSEKSNFFPSLLRGERYQDSRSLVSSLACPEMSPSWRCVPIFFFSFSTRFPLYLSFSISFSVIVLHVPDSSSYFLIFNACVFLPYLFFIPLAVSFELLPLFISLSFYFITEVKRNHRRSSTP